MTTPSRPAESGRRAKQTYVWFPFHAPIEYEQGKPRRPQLFKTRDGSASVELAPVLARAGYAYAGQYINPPCRLVGRNRPPRQKRKAGEDAWLADTGLILLTIRPPIDNEAPEDRGRHSIPRSYSWLEDAVVDRLRDCFFFSCSRDAVQLATRVREHVDPALRHLRFKQNAVAGSWLKDRADRPIDPRSTIGFVAYIPRDEAGGMPAILTVFGMGGNDTLRVAHLLGVRAPALLGRVLASPGPRLVLFRLTPPDDLGDGKTFPPPGLLAPRCVGWGFEQVADVTTGGGP